jgi:hypothetical protein
LYVKDLEKDIIEDKDLNKHQKDKEELIIPGPYTIAHPGTVVIIHHDTRVTDLAMSGALRFYNL